MPFLNDYILFNSDNECHRNYHLWSGLFLLAATAGRKFYCKQGYFDIHPNLYICLVGKQGNRKSTAKDIARDIFADACPNIPIGASVQSREDIVKHMAHDDQIRFFTDENGQPIEYRPIVFFVNELKNFLSINPQGMIEFLTDIYDRKYFDASTIKRGLEKIINPCVNFLGCETPSWIVDRLKMNIISGGFARRVIYVYEIEEGRKIAFPNPSAEALAARERCVNHLRRIDQMPGGEMLWDDDAKEYYTKWYNEIKAPEDETMAGYYRSKHIQAIKGAMSLGLGEDTPKLRITKANLEIIIAMLDTLEINMPRLSIAAGRNELAVPTQRALELLEAHGGYMREKQLRILIGRDLNPMEQMSVLNYLQRDTEQTTKVPMIRGTTTFQEIWLVDKFRKAILDKKVEKHPHVLGAYLWKGE